MKFDRSIGGPQEGKFSARGGSRAENGSRFRELETRVVCYMLVGLRAVCQSLFNARPRCCHKLESRVTRDELVYGAQIFTSIYKLRYLLVLLSAGTLAGSDDNLIFPESIHRRLRHPRLCPPFISQYLRRHQPDSRACARCTIGESKGQQLRAIIRSETLRIDENRTVHE